MKIIHFAVRVCNWKSFIKINREFYKYVVCSAIQIYWQTKYLPSVCKQFLVGGDSILFHKSGDLFEMLKFKNEK